MNQSRIVKVGYVIVLWIAFNALFVVQTIYYYGLNEVRYLLYFLEIEIVLVVLTIWIKRSRKVGLPMLIALSLVLGFIPYEYGVPFLLNAVGGAIDACREFVCEATPIIRLVRTFACSIAFFLLLLPMRRTKGKVTVSGSLPDRP